MENALRRIACIESSRLRENPLCIIIHDRIEHWIQSLNLPDMSLGQLGHGQLTRSHQLQLASGRSKHQLTHERQPLGSQYRRE